MLPFLALMILVGQQAEHLTCKEFLNNSVLVDMTWPGITIEKLAG